MAKSFIKIENPGVADPTAFTLLGASTSRSSADGRTIGRFGSGNKHGVAVCLRNDAAPVVFAGSLRMTFGTTDVKVDTGLHTKTFARVNVKYSGKDRNGKSKTATEDLGFVLEYGAEDWSGIDLALREFVSNAIDRAIEEDGDWSRVVIEVVEENQVRAKDGTTRVFIPVNDDVFDFFRNLGKWFLHFSEPHLINQVILPKRNRNLNGRKAAVIYRRGVRVREFESSDMASLFDYNLDTLKLDESRKVDDWRVKNEAAKALRDADKNTLANVILSFGPGVTYWEHEFDSYGLISDGWGEDKEKISARETAWKGAIQTVLGDTGILASKDTLEGDIAIRKGYSPVSVPSAFVKAAKHYGIKTVDQVISQDDRDGRSIRDADQAAIAAVDWAWNLCEISGMTNGKDKPDVKVFDRIMNAGVVTLGFYRDGTVYLNGDITGEAGNMSQVLLATALEEVVHHTTQAQDGSRDMQDYILNLVVKLAS